MLLLDRYLGAHFFDTQAGGSAVLWMHFFWIFGHPEVYVLVIPAFAFVSEIIPVFSRKAIFGYPIMVAATLAIGFVSMSVWAHHMFTVGMSSEREHVLRAVDDGHRRPDRHQDLQLAGNHVGRKDSLQDADAVLHRLSLPVPDRRPHRHHDERRRPSTGSLEIPTSWWRTSTTSSSAASCSRSSAPSTTGSRRCRERCTARRWASCTSVLFVIGFHLTFDFMHIPGLLGMPRRIYTYEPGRGWDIWNLLVTIGVVFQAAGILVFVGNLLWSYFKGKSAGSDPWDAWTLEWSTSFAASRV